MEANDAAISKTREAVESMDAHTMATDTASEKVLDTAQAGDGPRSNR